MKFLWIALALFASTLSSAAVTDGGSWIDDSYEIFLTKKIKSAATSYRDYPIFWWNFIIIEKGETPDAALLTADRLCRFLSESGTVGIAKLPCQFNAGGIREFAESWLADAPLRRDFPGRVKFRENYQGALAKAALPLPRDILEWLRKDPLDELGALRKKMENRKVGALQTRGGFLFEPGSGRVLVPLQFSFPPTHSGETRKVHDAVQEFCQKDSSCPGVTLFGAHAGSMENEYQIRDDINDVSTVGTVSLALLILFIIWSRRYRLMLLLPILGVTVAIAAAITVAVYGSIHAICLSFGPGLVGLAMDYGVHAAFLNSRDKHTWRANFMALMTSLVIMVLLGFSSIPLLQQMMFFGVVGLTLAYVVFYFALTRFPKVFAVEPFNLTPKPWPAMETVSWVCLLGAALIFVQPLSLDLKHLSFETPKTSELNRWFFATSGEGTPYNLPEAPQIQKWAEENSIRYEGPSTLLPPLDEQERHLATWREPCAQGLFRNDSNAQKFFAPFEKLVCASLAVRGLELPGPAYLRDYTDGRKWTAVLLPSGDSQVAKVREQYPQAASPREMISEFPKTFAFELAWMLPISLIGALIFLYTHYRNIGLTLLACVPFLTGVGGFALMALPLGLSVTFISLMGLLMVFGFSIDYGIFAVDYMCDPRHERKGVWSALTICAATTLAGFTPMAMGHHPVLHNLGHSLLWGSVGTYIGTFWGVPAGYRLLYASRRSRSRKKATA